MTTRNNRHRTAWALGALLLAAALAVPSTAFGWTRTGTTFRPVMTRLQLQRVAPTISLSPVRALAGRSLTLAALEPPPARRTDGSEYRAQSALAVSLAGSFGPLAGGEVAVTGPESFTARATAGERLNVPAGVPLIVAVTATGLVDRPTRLIADVVLREGSSVTTLPFSFQTGVIRAQATVAGRRVAGVVRLYRINPATGQAAATASGTIGATGAANEISAGRYRAVLHYGGTTLTRDVQVRPGEATLVRLVG